jgi:transcriptional regulator with XRE-family HTH domain
METHRENLARRTRFGSLLADWRHLRRVSQMTLAMDAEISQRHLSFIESGRAQPSRETVLTITEALDMPLRARNELLDAAGFAAFYPERPLEGAEMDRTRETLRRVLAHHEPYPAMVLDRSWNILMTNDASMRVISQCVNESVMAQISPDGRPNFMRLMFHPSGMKPHVRSWARTAPILIGRLRREAAAYPGSPSKNLLRELLPDAPDTFIPGIDDAPLAPTVALELEIRDEVLRLFNTLTTFGTPQDVTLQELRIEMSYPMDDASDALLRRWAE